MSEDQEPYVAEPLSHRLARTICTMTLWKDGRPTDCLGPSCTCGAWEDFNLPTGQAMAAEVAAAYEDAARIATHYSQDEAAPRARHGISLAIRERAREVLGDD